MELKQKINFKLNLHFKKAAESRRKQNTRSVENYTFNVPNKDVDARRLVIYHFPRSSKSPGRALETPFCQHLNRFLKLQSVASSVWTMFPHSCCVLLV